MIEVLRELLRETRQRVDAAVYVEPKPKPVTETARHKGRYIKSLWKQMRIAARELSRQGYDVVVPSFYQSSRVGHVRAAHKPQADHKAAWSRAQQARKDRILAIRRSALIDTIGMDKQSLVNYMRQVQKTLGEV